MSTQHPGTLLRQMAAQRRGLLVPGAANALAARVIEQLGFEAVYLSGAGLTNTFYGLPDLGFVGEERGRLGAVVKATGMKDE